MSDGHNQNATLPETGVLFVGGHHNMVKRIMQIHPKWDYRHDDRMNKTHHGRYHVVIMWSNHLSHKLFNFVRAHMDGKSVVIYVKSTNVDNLMAEIEQKYQEIVSREK